MADRSLGLLSVSVTHLHVVVIGLSLPLLCRYVLAPLSLFLSGAHVSPVKYPVDCTFIGKSRLSGAVAEPSGYWFGPGLNISVAHIHGCGWAGVIGVSSRQLIIPSIGSIFLP